MSKASLQITDNGVDEASNLGVIFAFLLLCAATITVMWLYPRGDNLTVVMNPFSSVPQVARLLEQSDSQLMNQGRFAWVVNIYAPNPHNVQRLFSAGAIIVIRNIDPSTCFQEVLI